MIMQMAMDHLQAGRVASVVIHLRRADSRMTARCAFSIVLMHYFEAPELQILRHLHSLSSGLFVAQLQPMPFTNCFDAQLQSLSSASLHIVDEVLSHPNSRVRSSAAAIFAHRRVSITPTPERHHICPICFRRAAGGFERREVFHCTDRTAMSTPEMRPTHSCELSIATCFSWIPDRQTQQRPLAPW